MARLRLAAVLVLLTALLNGCGAPAREPPILVPPAPEPWPKAERPFALAEQEVVMLINVAYFESGWKERASECSAIAGTVMARLFHPRFPAFGQNIFEILRPSQFHAVADVALCESEACEAPKSLREGQPLSNFTHYRNHQVSGTYRISPLVTEQYQICEEAVRKALAKTPTEGYLNFRAAGDGTNIFSNPSPIPSSLDLSPRPEGEDQSIEDILRKELAEPASNPEAAP